MSVIKKLLVDLLQHLIDQLNAGTCEMSEDEMLLALEILGNADTNRPMSKDQACSYCNMSRSTFDNNVKIGILPKGHKVRGFKELHWIKSEIDAAIEKLKLLITKLLEKK